MNDRFFIRLVGALTLLIPTYLVRFPLFGIPTTLFEVLLWFVFIYALATHRITPKLLKDDPLRRPILLLGLASVIAVFVAPDLRGALGQWKAIIFDGLMFYLLVRAAGPSPKIYGTIIYTALLGGAVIATYALLQLTEGTTTVDGRVIGIYAVDVGASPNYLALYLAPLATIALVTAVERFFAKHVFSGTKYLALFVLMLGALIASGSRGGLLALGVGALLGLTWLMSRLWPNYRTVAIILTAVMFVVGFVVAVPSFLPDLTAQQEAGGRLVTSNNVRFEIWRTTVDTIIPQTSLFGLGWDNYQPVFTELTKDRINYPEYIAPLALHPHNFWLMTWVTLGLLGTIGWIWLFGRLFQQFPSLSLPQIAVAAGFIAFLVHGLVDTTFYKNDLSPLLFLIVAGLLITKETKLHSQT